ncbi:hypothetical protein TNCV_2646621 [Trichonephila clavipes]|nr:hypothetical protein TNCV_2646621 [Trichonephila clavipes]
MVDNHESGTVTADLTIICPPDLMWSWVDRYHHDPENLPLSTHSRQYLLMAKSLRLYEERFSDLRNVPFQSNDTTFFKL